MLTVHPQFADFTDILVEPPRCAEFRAGSEVLSLELPVDRGVKGHAAASPQIVNSVLEDKMTSERAEAVLA